MKMTKEQITTLEQSLSKATNDELVDVYKYYVQQGTIDAAYCMVIVRREIIKRMS